MVSVLPEDWLLRAMGISIGERLTVFRDQQQTRSELHTHTHTRTHTSFIRPTLEYAAVAWSPHFKKHMKKIEKIQRWVPSPNDLSYEERLEKLQLPNLQEVRRKRGDMLMLSKCVEGKEKIDSNEYTIPTQLASKIYSKKLFKKRLKKNTRKFSFPFRAID